jgi:hypothetical protein
MPQAWAAAAPLYLLQYCAGLAFDTAAQRVTFHEPLLPRFLEEVVLRAPRMEEAAPTSPFAARTGISSSTCSIVRDRSGS